MTYILIVMWGNSKGVSTLTQEFYSMAEGQAALEDIKSGFINTGMGNFISGGCYPKGWCDVT